MTVTVNNDRKIIEKAGGIVVQITDEDIYTLLVYRHNHDDWTFPKGSLEANELHSEAATREIREECGINVQIIQELEPLEYINKRSGEQTKVYMYLLYAKDTQIKSEYKEDKVRWVKIADVEERLSYENLKTYFKNQKKKAVSFSRRSQGLVLE